MSTRPLLDSFPEQGYSSAHRESQKRYRVGVTTCFHMPVLMRSEWPIVIGQEFLERQHVYVDLDSRRWHLPDAQHSG